MGTEKNRTIWSKAETILRVHARAHRQVDIFQTVSRMVGRVHARASGRGRVGTLHNIRLHAPVPVRRLVSISVSIWYLLSPQTLQA